MSPINQSINQSIAYKKKISHLASYAYLIYVSGWFLEMSQKSTICVAIQKHISSYRCQDWNTEQYKPFTNLGLKLK